MAQRQMTVSDLSGEVIADDGDAVTIVVLDHPQIEAPVSLDASKTEVESIGGVDKEFVILELLTDGGDSKERVVLELAEFDKLFKGDVDDVLSQAPLYGRQSAPVIEAPRRGRPPASAKPASEKTDYTAEENYGTLHRGRTTDAEAELVRNNLDQANANRRRLGQPEIDLNSAKDVKRYGLQELAKKAGVTLTPEFTG